MDAVTVAEGFKSTRSLGASEITQLKLNLRGPLVLPEDHAYENGRKVWNGTVDKRPAVIVYVPCSGRRRGGELCTIT